MYSVEISPVAEKQIKALPKKEQIRVIKRIFKLADDPIPPNSKKLKGVESLYRVRQGDWRIVYTVENQKLSVLVVKVKHRREVYR